MLVDYGPKCFAYPQLSHCHPASPMVLPCLSGANRTSTEHLKNEANTVFFSLFERPDLFPARKPQIGS